MRDNRNSNIEEFCQMKIAKFIPIKLMRLNWIESLSFDCRIQRSHSFNWFLFKNLPEQLKVEWNSDGNDLVIVIIFFLFRKQKQKLFVEFE